MMKKYIAPTMNVMEMEAVSLLAGSGGNSVSSTLSDQTPTDVSFHSREFSIWPANEEE